MFQNSRCLLLASKVEGRRFDHESIGLSCAWSKMLERPFRSEGLIRRYQFVICAWAASCAFCRPIQHDCLSWSWKVSSFFQILRVSFILRRIGQLQKISTLNWPALIVYSLPGDRLLEGAFSNRRFRGIIRSILWSYHNWNRLTLSWHVVVNFILVVILR